MITHDKLNECLNNEDSIHNDGIILRDTCTLNAWLRILKVLIYNEILK